MEEKNKLNVYQKLQKSRVELQNKKLKKSGKNKYAGFVYYELADFIPAVNEIFNNNGLFSEFNIDKELATLRILNTENLEEVIEFKSPIADANLKGCTPIQSLGGVHTYMKRYLYLNALEIVESDMFDSKAGDMQLEDKKAPVKKNEVKIQPRQIEIISQYYVGENMDKLLKANNLTKLEDMTMIKASEIIKKLQEMKKKEEEN